MNANPRIDLLPIDTLTPCRGCNVSRKRRKRLRTSLQSVGLLNPLTICERGDHHDILGGRLRHKILQELGGTIIPCFVLKEVRNHE